MEEIITVDGRQFKLSTDRPLTAQEKAQTISEIRKQTGCGTCGPNVAKMGNDWQGGIKSMVAGFACPAPGTPGSATAPKPANPPGNTVGLAAAPMVGTAPYTVEFFRNPALNAGNTEEDVTESMPFSRIPGTYTNYTTGVTATTANPQTNVAEAVAAGTPTISVTYTLNDVDIAQYARSRAEGEGPSILFRVSTTDSCPTPGPQTCTEYCKVFVICPTPSCNFTVT